MEWLQYLLAIGFVLMFLLIYLNTFTDIFKDD